MSLDLSFDDAQQAIVDAMTQFCRDRCPDSVIKDSTGKFPERLWRELADLGVLALVTPEGEGGAMEMTAALEGLGAAVFPGPLVASFFATQLLGEGDRRAVSRGEAVVSVGAPPLMPWAPSAHLFLAIEDGRVWKGAPRGGIDPVDTLGGEPWGRVDLEPVEDLGPAERGLQIYDTALAAYLAAAGRRLIEDTAEHARTRKQFGKTIGEFQAVAHPLADGSMRLAAAGTLARCAATRIDAGEADAGVTAAAARLSATRAAVEAAHTCHQLFGAIGITLEGPVFHVSRRIRQLASQPPGDRAPRDTVLSGFGL